MGECGCGCSCDGAKEKPETIKIGVIATTKNAVQPTLDAFARYAPEAYPELYVDEGLLAKVQEDGGVTPDSLRRFASLLARPEESGAAGILFTCTVFSPSLSALEPFFAIPMVSVDGAMLEMAAAQDGRVGLIATVAQTEKMAVEQLRDWVTRRGTKVDINSALVSEAFAALPGDPEKHDALIFEAAQKMADRCDRFVLAQISMARAAEKVATLGKPVLTSLESSIKSIMIKARAGKQA